MSAELRVTVVEAPSPPLWPRVLLAAVVAVVILGGQSCSHHDQVIPIDGRAKVTDSVNSIDPRTPAPATRSVMGVDTDCVPHSGPPYCGSRP